MFGMHTVLISLARRLDRRSAFLDSYRDVAGTVQSVHVFNAFDGQTLGLDAPEARGNRISSRPLGKLTPGEIGCHLSHVAVAKSALGDHDSVLVFEDDVAFSAGARLLWTSFMSELPADWQILHLGVKASHNAPPAAVSGHVHRIKDSWGAYAYALRRDALYAVASQNAIEKPFDWVLRDLMSKHPSYGPRHEILSVNVRAHDSDCGPRGRS